MNNEITICVALLYTLGPQALRRNATTTPGRCAPFHGTTPSSRGIVALGQATIAENCWVDVSGGDEKQVVFLRCSSCHENRDRRLSVWKSPARTEVLGRPIFFAEGHAHGPNS